MGPFTFMQLNIRGINEYSKFQTFKMLMDKLNIKIDIIVLGETKLKQTFPINLYNISGYQRYVCCRKSTKDIRGKDVGGGGLIVFIKNSLIVTNTTNYTANFERITLKVMLNEHTFKVITYYRPPENQKMINYDDFIKDLENELTDHDGKVIVCGDINLDILNNTKQVRSYKNLLDGYNLEIINNVVTRDASGTILDHAIINFKNEINVTNYTISMDKSMTDHNMIITTFSNMKTPKNKKMTKKIVHIDFNKLKDNFLIANATEKILMMTDTNEIASSIIDVTKNAIQKSSIVINVKIKSNSKFIPWCNKRLRTIMKMKEKIRCKLRKNKFSIPLKLKYKNISKSLKNEIIKAERKFNFRNLTIKNTKQVWKSLNSLLGREKNTGITILRHNDDVVTDKERIASMFNKQFVESVNETINNIPEAPCNFSYKSIPNSIHLENTDPEEIKLIIFSLKKVAPGMDGIKSQVVKTLNDELSPLLCHLINRMFETGKYPDIFKVAIVTPINKSGRFTDINDYRPVSILSCFNKVAEKIIYRRISNFIEANNILSCMQFGFRQKSNTEFAAAEMVNDLQKLLDKKKKVSLVFMDIKKAFDTVQKHQVLDSLYRCGIRGTLWDLINDYLTNRRQIVRIDNNNSEEIYIENGVVQGGILSSLLFIIFFNDITTLKLNGNLYLYADDVLLMNENDKSESVEIKIKQDLNIIYNFLISKRMSLNKAKTFYMIVHSPYMKINDNDSIVVRDGFSINRHRNAKYLGLYIDDNLKWDIHGQQLESKLSSTVGILWKLRNRLPIHVKKTIYHTLCETHISYMSMIWGTANENVLKPLQVIQNRILKSVFNLPRLTNRVQMYTHKVENCLPIRAICYLNAATYIYKNVKNICLTNIVLQERSQKRRELRNKNIIESSNANTKYGKKSITAFGVKIYNGIPDDIKQLKNPAQFKWALKAHLRNEDFIKSCLTGDFLKKFC